MKPSVFGGGLFGDAELDALQARTRATLRRGVVRAVAPARPVMRPAASTPARSAPPRTAASNAWYRPVLERDVPAFMALRVARTLSDVGAHLQIQAGSVPVRWFEPCAKGDPGAIRASRQLVGFCPDDGGSIYLNTAQGVAAAVKTCAHELRHVHQARTGFTGDRLAAENDAYAFADKWMNR